MRISKATSSALTAAAVLTILAGCSGGSSQLAPPLGGDPSSATQPVRELVVAGRRFSDSVFVRNSLIGVGHPVIRSFFSTAAKGKPLIFVSDATNNVVDIYLQAHKNKLVGQITGFTYLQGVATDRAGNLYVATQPNSPQIFVYAPPYTGAPRLTLNDSGGFPTAVAISRWGVVAVANECNVPSCGAGTSSITFYAKNSTEPCATIALDPTKFSYLAYGAAFDHNGNFYFDGANSTFSSVFGEISGGCKATKARLLTTTNTVKFAQGIQIDKRGRVAVVDTSSALIDTYEPPKKGSFGSPVSTTLLTGSSNPVTIAFLSSGCAFYVTDGTDDVVNEYKYPAGGAATNTISVGGTALGVSVTPPLVP